MPHLRNAFVGILSLAFFAKSSTALTILFYRQTSSTPPALSWQAPKRDLDQRAEDEGGGDAAAESSLLRNVRARLGPVFSDTVRSNIGKNTLRSRSLSRAE
jgi:hypothetical protein